MKLGHIEPDGTKIKANASRHNAMSYAGMKRREAELAAGVASWLQKAGRADQREDAAHGRNRRSDELSILLVQEMFWLPGSLQLGWQALPTRFV